ncbi:hypothetical protein K1719_043960 [Acacia pycnantha]|nr:hypothetical protein K1719_043960 [Acacia pycnantha]
MKVLGRLVDDVGMSADRNRRSLVWQRWIQVEGQSRHHLSLNGQSDLLLFIPSLFIRFNSVTKLALKCDRRSVSIGDEALVLISQRCPNLTRLKLRACRELADAGMEEERPINIYLSHRVDDPNVYELVDKLCAAFETEGLTTFEQDQDLETEDSLPDYLLKPIHEAWVYIFFFCKKDATSRGHLMELKEITWRIHRPRGVILIFYDLGVIQAWQVKFRNGSQLFKLKYQTDLN